ncbi:MAG: hypothetical protein IJP07_07440, partial [Firmicutes bacterium]|nr:hypothetical protein [Bacillota bacterium]
EKQGPKIKVFGAPFFKKGRFTCFSLVSPSSLKRRSKKLLTFGLHFSFRSGRPRRSVFPLPLFLKEERFADFREQQSRP